MQTEVSKKHLYGYCCRKSHRSPEIGKLGTQKNDALAQKIVKSTIEKDWTVEKLKSLDSSKRKSIVDSKL